MGVMYSIEPIKKSQYFVHYSVGVHDDLGLFTIVAKTAPEDEAECKQTGLLLSLLLGSAYGKKELYDGSYIWGSDEHPKLNKENLESIILHMLESEGKKCWMLGYFFKNNKKAKESSVSPF